jgi:RNA 2',3'-cyclic 3'-phosphodiesterase
VAGLLARGAALAPAKWLPPEKLHVTLQYLGHPTPEALEGLAAKLDGLAHGRAPFVLSIGGTGLFETRRAPSVLWLGVHGALGELAALQQAVASAWGKPDDKPFVPHLTLARGRGQTTLDSAAREFAAFHSAEFRVDAVTLYESKDHVYRIVRKVGFS